ncbi:hypothetical protein RD055328_08520 [Companilactobacillus sp. RD055328]|uniref:hypothetical protein n=1 Tax=Companilactobacillus sp. RD055328 TaxID=2916634 RepID=UPI001FC8549C|nr:hypothetical protein [Companilactobacillus sp. RD055328]GKQ42929.1 hypothetical protein RD055328_08520 [Companilactobacillus sp. RD055328]
MKTIELILETEKKLKNRYHVKSILDVPDSDPELKDMQEYLKPTLEVNNGVKPKIQTIQRAQRIKDLLAEGLTNEQIASKFHWSKNKLSNQITYFKKIGIY